MQRDGAVLPQMQAAGEPLPDWAHEPPITKTHLFYLSAYFDLDTDRPINGWVIAPIPRRHIAAYAREKGLGGELLDAFVFIVRQMDNAHIQWMRDEQAANAPPKR